jgi:hypothetical protein
MPQSSLDQGLVFLIVALWIRGILRVLLAGRTTNGVKLELWASWLGQIGQLLTANVQGSSGVLHLGLGTCQLAFRSSQRVGSAGWRAKIKR